MKNPIRSLWLNPLPTPRSVLASATPGPDLTGRTVLLTGASSGIGEAIAHALADHGARLILVARGADELGRVRDELVAAGGDAHIVPTDLTDAESVDALVATVTTEFGTPDVVVNNAGRSIRRTAFDAADRFHDYERTMALNYFGPVRLTLALLPALRAAGGGHVINIATWGTTAGVMPKFTAYHASKAALAAFGRSLGAEEADSGVVVTTLGFPLVRTPMIAPTADYDSQAALTPEEAAAWVLTAIRTRPVELFPAYAALLRLISVASPRVADRLVRQSGI